MPVTPSELIRTYIQAKDGNRSRLLDRVFTDDARLEIRNHSAQIDFPATTIGREAIADVLVRTFNQTYENIYTFCMDRPRADAASFGCLWLVGMTEKDSRNVRVGCGHYDWKFDRSPMTCVSGLVITIASMTVLPPQTAEAVFRWLDAVSYPWASIEEIGGVPPLSELSPVVAFLARRVAEPAAYSSMGSGR